MTVETKRKHLLKTTAAGSAELAKVEGIIADSHLPAGIKHLVKLRVSQINGCVYCVGMHNKEARDDGEIQDRLDHLVVWRQCGKFSEPEMAALAWAEALTLHGPETLEHLHDELERHFDHDTVGALTLSVVMINAWNRLAISMHGDTF